MKKQYMAFLASILLLSSAAMAQTPNEKKEAEPIWINSSSHNFGNIPQGTPVYTQFVIKSNTADSLKLEMVQAGCGCTTPEYKAGAYAPNQEVVIKVGFNAAAPGAFTKPVTITYNGGQQKVINITGTVITTPATPAPTNGALGKIKP